MNPTELADWLDQCSTRSNGGTQMSTDLINRLRSVDRVFATEAADRIEQLERENAELRKDAARYYWLVANRKYWSWQPSRYNHGITSGFAAYGTGYLGFDFEAAIDAAMKEQQT